MKNFRESPKIKEGARASLIHWLIDRTDDELSEIWVELNCWRFPSIIPTEFKPK